MSVNYQGNRPGDEQSSETTNDTRQPFSFHAKVSRFSHQRVRTRQHISRQGSELATTDPWESAVLDVLFPAAKTCAIVPAPGEYPRLADITTLRKAGQPEAYTRDNLSAAIRETLGKNCDTPAPSIQSGSP